MAEKRLSRSNLRKEYPHIPFNQFNLIIDTLGIDDPDGLRAILAEEDDKAKASVAEERERIRERFDEITASMLHRKLILPPLPDDVDVEHAQAHLAYGLGAASGTKKFTGGNYIPQQHIRSNVENKLGLRFDGEKHATAEALLLRNGVLGGKGGVAGLIAYSLRVNESARGVTPLGKQIIIATKKFMHENRPRNGK